MLKILGLLEMNFSTLFRVPHETIWAQVSKSYRISCSHFFHHSKINIFLIFVTNAPPTKVCDKAAAAAAAVAAAAAAAVVPLGWNAEQATSCYLLGLLVAPSGLADR